MERLRMVPSPRLAARLFELSHAQLLEIAVAGCEASPEVTNQADAILAANNPLAQRLVEEVLLSSDLAPHVLAPLPLEDRAAAAVCSLWAEGWKVGRPSLSRQPFDLPADEPLEGLYGMSAIPGDDEKLLMRFGDMMRIIDRSMRTVTSSSIDCMRYGFTADEQSFYISTAVDDGYHQRLTHDGAELACYKEPFELSHDGQCPVLAPGGLLFCIHWTGDGDHEEWQEIIALDAHSMQLRYRFGKSLLNGARGLAVIGEELFVCDTDNDRLQVFSLAGEHRRSITGEWKRPSSLCVIKDRLYLVEDHMHRDRDRWRIGYDLFGPSPYTDKQTRGRRIFILSLQGETLQVYPIPARQWNSFIGGDLCCFDGKLLVTMYTSDPEGTGVAEIVALA